jgi:hypothetical protein
VPYEQVVEWAKAVEIVGRAGDHRRLSLLGNYARSGNPKIAAWAMHALGCEGTRGSIDLLHQLAQDGAVSLSGQEALDMVLSNIDDQWVGSNEHLRFLSRQEKVRAKAKD